MFPVNNYKCLAFCFYAATMYVVVNVPFRTQLHFRDIEAGRAVVLYCDITAWHSSFMLMDKHRRTVYQLPG